MKKTSSLQSFNALLKRTMFIILGMIGGLLCVSCTGSPALSPTDIEGTTKVLFVETAIPTVARTKIEPTKTSVPTSTKLVEPTKTSVPTSTKSVEPTKTHTPTATTAPTNTRTPTATIAPTNTHTPTATIAPTNTHTPTATTAPAVLPTEQATATGPTIIITSVNKVAEFVEIQNQGTSEVNLSGWNLVSEKGNQDCPLSGTLQAGETLQIWAMDVKGTGYSCGYSKNIWNNSEPDPAVLYNLEGLEVSRK